MIEKLKQKHKFTGETIQEAISKIPNELPVDAVGLWQIIPDGKEGFGLGGEELCEYISLTIQALLEAGAKPVYGVRRGEFSLWLLHKEKYVGTDEEIIASIIKDWKEAEQKDKNYYDNFIFSIWFALPEFIENE